MNELEIAELVESWRHGTTLMENANYIVEVVALFDHDFQYHLLARVHEKHGNDSCYALFFIDTTITILNKTWHDKSVVLPPFTQCAQIVDDWMQMLLSTTSHGGE